MNFKKIKCKKNSKKRDIYFQFRNPQLANNDKI